MDEYENLVVAIALIDCAVEHLENAETHDDAASQLNALRNDLNADRVAILRNGADRPWSVNDLDVSQDNS